MSKRKRSRSADMGQTESDEDAGWQQDGDSARSSSEVRASPSNTKTAYIAPREELT